MKRTLNLYFLALVLLLTAACKKNKGNKKENPEEKVFDKQGMLANLADNLIMPRYKAFEKSLDSLIVEYTAFKSSPTNLNMEVVRQRFQTCYGRYQDVSLFEFGPAEQEIIRSNFNVFPADTQQIKSNISSGVYNLSSASNLDAKGLPALDYLFYGTSGNIGEAATSFSINVNKRQYVSDLLSDIKAKLARVIASWDSGYREEFVNSLGTDVGSSIGFLINQMNFELDYLKNSKIGLPVGKKTLGVALPDRCESYYNGAQSVFYAMATLNAIETTYLGKSSTGLDGLGFDDYIRHLGIQRGTASLHNAIQEQFSLARAKLSALNAGTPLSKLVVSNVPAVDAAYLELVKLLVLLKTDLPSNLGVVITYQDGDGD